MGSGEVHQVDVRIVAATNVDLASLVAAGRFREDLYYRLNVVHLVVPPLRERFEDVPELVAHFLARAGAKDKPVEPAAMERILGDAWRGNLRALRNCIERALVLAGTEPIRAEHIVLEQLGGHRPPPEPGTAIYTGVVELNERQLALIERLREVGVVTNADHSGRAGVTLTTGWRDLTELVAKGVLVRSGRSKKTTYQLAPAWEARIMGRM
jgi:DNA-binding NtrC family response regulator